VFTLWIVLLLVQTALITTRQVRVHRRLGLVGFGLAVLMVVLGVLAATDALRRGAGPNGLSPETFYVIPITDMVLFSVFAFFAYRERFRPEAHKRLILIATIALLDAAVGRWPVAALMNHGPRQDLVVFGFLLLIAVYDLLSLRRISSATLWASGLLIVIHAVRVPLGMSEAWQSFVKHLIGKV